MKLWIWIVGISLFLLLLVLLITYLVWWSPAHRKTQQRSRGLSADHKEVSSQSDVIDLSTLSTSPGYASSSSSSSFSTTPQALLLYDSHTAGLLSVTATPLVTTSSSLLKGFHPVYDRDTDRWWYMDVTEGRLATASWDAEAGVFHPADTREAPLSPVLREAGLEPHFIIQHGWCLCFGSTSISFWRLQQPEAPFVWSYMLPGVHTGVILSDGTVVLLHQEKYKLYRVTSEHWAEGPQEFYIEGIHQPQYLLPFTDEDAFVLSSALDERSFWIDASDPETDFIKKQVFSHVSTTLYHTQDLVWLADHTSEHIYTYDRHSLSVTATSSVVQCSSSVLSVPGGSHLQTHPPSGFGTSLLFIEAAQLLVVSAPYQHGIHNGREEAGLLYVFCMERTSTPDTFVYTPTHVLRSSIEEQQDTYHFGLSLHWLKERLFVYQDPGLLTSHLLWS